MGVMIERKKRLMMQMQGGLLPAEYRQVEYLECSGTQYIITDYSPAVDNVEVTWEYMFTIRQFGDQMLWGARGSTTIKTWQCEYYNQVAWYCAVGAKNYRNVLSGIGCDLNVKYTGHVDSDYLTINGQTAQSTDNRTGSNTQYIAIFAWRAGNGEAEYMNKGCRIYSLEFKENGVASANFIPCVRKSDSKPGMYDTVSKTFYTNAGTGEFIIPT